MTNSEDGDVRETISGLAKLVEKRLEYWKPSGMGSLSCKKRILAGFCLTGVNQYSQEWDGRFVKIGVEYVSGDIHPGVHITKVSELQEDYNNEETNILIVLGGYLGESNTNNQAYMEFAIDRFLRRDWAVSLRDHSRQKAVFGGVFSKYKPGNGPYDCKIFLEDVASFIADPESVPVIMKKVRKNET